VRKTNDNFTGLVPEEKLTKIVVGDSRNTGTEAIASGQDPKNCAFSIYRTIPPINKVGAPYPRLVAKKQFVYGFEFTNGDFLFHIPTNDEVTPTFIDIKCVKGQ
jgi:hypothetical protein